METIAIYWEEKIRTYGINLLEGLVLGRIPLSIDRIGQWGGMLQSSDASKTAFRLVWAQSEPPDLIRICIVCDEIHCQMMHPALVSVNDAGESFEWMPVDLIYFQGPHFGDRYGIMDFALRALAPRQVPLLGSVCAMTTVYLVLPGGGGRAACDALTQAFEIPTTTTGRGNRAQTAVGIDE
jgi:hypothetical protein